MKSVVYNQDCLEAMRQMDDKAFDLAIVDPPFGWGSEMFLNRPTSSKRENKLGVKYDLRGWNDEPPPKGISVFSGEDSYVVSREFIDYYANHFAQEDAVRRLEYSNADLAR